MTEITNCDRCGGEMWSPGYDKDRPWICGVCQFEDRLQKSMERHAHIEEPPTHLLGKPIVYVDTIEPRDPLVLGDLSPPWPRRRKAHHDATEETP